MSLTILQPFPIDGRQSSTALAVARGATRLLHSLGLCVVSELALASGRRADLVALRADGTIWIVEETVRARLGDLGQDIPPPDQQTPEALFAHHTADIEK